MTTTWIAAMGIGRFLQGGKWKQNYGDGVELGINPGEWDWKIFTGMGTIYFTVTL